MTAQLPPHGQRVAAATAVGQGRPEPPRIPRIPGAESARGRCPFLHRPGPGAIGRGQPAQRRRRPPGPGPGAERREEEEAGLGRTGVASLTLSTALREREGPGGDGRRARVPLPHSRPGLAVTCGPGAPPRAAPPRQGGGGGVNPWRGGAGGAEQSRKRPGREAGEAAVLRRRRKGVGSPAAVAAFASSFRPLRGARRAGGTCHSRQGERGVLRGERRRRRERPGTAQRARRGEGCGDDAGE